MAEASGNVHGHHSVDTPRSEVLSEASFPDSGTVPASPLHSEPSSAHTGGRSSGSSGWRSGSSGGSYHLQPQNRPADSFTSEDTTRSSRPRPAAHISLPDGLLRSEGDLRGAHSTRRGEPRAAPWSAGPMDSTPGPRHAAPPETAPGSAASVRTESSEGSTAASRAERRRDAGAARGGSAATLAPAATERASPSSAAGALGHKEYPPEEKEEPSPLVELLERSQLELSSILEGMQSESQIMREGLPGGVSQGSGAIGLSESTDLMQWVSHRDSGESLMDEDDSIMLSTPPSPAQGGSRLSLFEGGLTVSPLWDELPADQLPTPRLGPAPSPTPIRVASGAPDGATPEESNVHVSAAPPDERGHTAPGLGADEAPTATPQGVPGRAAPAFLHGVSEAATAATPGAASEVLPAPLDEGRAGASAGEARSQPVFGGRDAALTPGDAETSVTPVFADTVRKGRSRRLRAKVAGEGAGGGAGKGGDENTPQQDSASRSGSKSTGDSSGHSRSTRSRSTTSLSGEWHSLLDGVDQPFPGDRSLLGLDLAPRLSDSHLDSPGLSPISSPRHTAHLTATPTNLHSNAALPPGLPLRRAPRDTKETSVERPGDIEMPAPAARLTEGELQGEHEGIQALSPVVLSPESPSREARSAPSTPSSAHIAGLVGPGAGLPSVGQSPIAGSPRAEGSGAQEGGTEMEAFMSQYMSLRHAGLSEEEAYRHANLQVTPERTPQGGAATMEDGWRAPTTAIELHMPGLEVLEPSVRPVDRPSPAFGADEQRREELARRSAARAKAVAGKLRQPVLGKSRSSRRGVGGTPRVLASGGSLARIPTSVQPPMSSRVFPGAPGGSSATRAASASRGGVGPLTTRGASVVIPEQSQELSRRAPAQASSRQDLHALAKRGGVMPSQRGGVSARSVSGRVTGPASDAPRAAHRPAPAPPPGRRKRVP
ncbi:hypothetical protein CYMTET_17095 [Cymbomonas tetramitiformis]|uniref:Uncharacterized protein n=1 Tax=Cymbomonas tetramitiformis TaxID=36881 RepID=A0AAE0GB22_9CHLO|nr:hypothetical protein CYMTET_17095 [Cymbomonas tetramitiformis]